MLDRRTQTSLFLLILILLLFLAAGCQSERGVALSGSMKTWFPVTLSLTGPEVSEEDDENPFLEFRLVGVFSHEESGERILIPGYFAADGDAAQTGASRGSIWRLHFVPDRPGRWSYEISLRKGSRIALDRDLQSGVAAPGDGMRGEFTVESTEPSSDDPRSRGKLRYVGQRYLQFAHSGDYFLKSGADSPENFLAYSEFDGTPVQENEVGREREGEAALAPRHVYEAHVGDWREGDPLWQDSRGKGIVGALNYLSEQGVNSVYFLTMNIKGDGDDVWPYTRYEERYRFDCSKLEQWQIVFDHMDRLGILLHVVLTETENESLFEAEEGGDFAASRKLYYRELVARFAHHSAVVWNLGEENGWNDSDWENQPQKKANTDEQRRQFASYLRELDPYDNPIVVHTLPGRYDEIYSPLLGFEALEGPSLQMGDVREVHTETVEWIHRSAEAGRPWFVCLDEIGPAHTGVKPDADDPDHYEVRHYALWGNLMAGGAGCEWYFGYQYPHNDLNLEDFRSRESMWRQTRHAVEFFQQHLPFAEMDPADELLSNADAYCLAKPGELYAVYIGSGQETEIWLPEARYQVSWFDPQKGGELQEGSLNEVAGPGYRSPGSPPSPGEQDWTILLKRTGEPPQEIPDPPQRARP